MSIPKNLRIVGYLLSVLKNQVLLYIFKLKKRLINFFISFFNDNSDFLQKLKIKRPLDQGF
jgi:hypothetical protein